MEGIKIVVVGDGAVGKTALIITFINDSFPADYLPTIADKFQKNLSVDSVIWILNIWDTAGQEGYARLRSLSYPETDIFLMCYSVVQISSFDNVRDKWIQEVRHYCPGFLQINIILKSKDTPMLLVGTKTDLRSDDKAVKQNGGQIITQQMGEAMVHNLKLNGYAECSAKLNEGINQIFQQAVRLHTANKKKKEDEKSAQKKGKCVIL